MNRPLRRLSACLLILSTASLSIPARADNPFPPSGRPETSSGGHRQYSGKEVAGGAIYAAARLFPPVLIVLAPVGFALMAVDGLKKARARNAPEVDADGTGWATVDEEPEASSHAEAE